jgi:phage-related baseplate assembly protein
LTLAFQRVNDAVRAVFLASARGADLDQIGAGFNVSRLVINPGDPDAVHRSILSMKTMTLSGNVSSFRGRS